MNDSEAAYKEALNTVILKHGSMVCPSLIDRITDNYFRVLYCCNINWNELLWQRMTYEVQNGARE